MMSLLLLGFLSQDRKLNLIFILAVKILGMLFLAAANILQIIKTIVYQLFGVT